jgi:hypothetical protein
MYLNEHSRRGAYPLKSSHLLHDSKIFDNEYPVKHYLLLLISKHQ